MIHQQQSTASMVPPLPPSRQSIPFLGQIRSGNSSGSTGSSSFNETTCEINPIHNNDNGSPMQSAGLIKSNGYTSSCIPSQQIMPTATSQSCLNSAKISPSTVSTDLNNDNPVVYGELVILGYNGCLPQGEIGRRRSKYQLLRKSNPNGIKKSKHYSVKQPQTSKAIQDKEQHSISYTLSRSQAIIVEYQHDEETDMFQIGRSSENPIDFVVIDTMMLEQQQEMHNRLQDNGIVSTKSIQSTISRFACRILVDRRPPYCARIYAAGFDSSKNIFLGEKATKWQTNGEIDGLTTNGILIMHPKQTFVNKMGGSASSYYDSKRATNMDVGGIWREVSVCGEIYSVRETRSASKKGSRIENETNVLKDGTLIDLCGATLIWRSSEGLTRSPNKKHLEEMIDQLNASRPQCPVGLNTLVIPRKSASLGAADDKQPYVYLKCGHVQGYHDWGQNKNSNSRTCPMCFKSGPIVKLTMGIEPSFCTSSGPPNYGFNPCGHMASESTVKYWSQVLIPHGTNGFHAMCPFCCTPLQGELGYVKLIFQ